jgi:GNAT superfamily N-acetyltransferase
MMEIRQGGMESEADWADGLVLWEKVFEVGPWLFHSLHRGHDDRQLADCGAVWVEGDLVSAADFFIRPTRDGIGSARPMGGIGSVATLSEHRGKGYSSELLSRAIARMEERGCEWSILFTGVNAHYEKQGWRTFPQRSISADIRPEAVACRDDLPVAEKEWWRPGEPAVLAPLFDAEFTHRPLTRARTPLAWNVAVRERLNRPGTTAFLAGSVEGPQGLIACEAYAVASFWNGGFDLIELAGSRDGQRACLASLIKRGREIGAERVGIQLPWDMVAGPEISEAFANVVSHSSGHTMAMPIASRMTWEEVEGAFASPAGCHLRLDDF